MRLIAIKIFNRIAALETIKCITMTHMLVLLRLTQLVSDLTKHVDGADGICLNGLDGVVHVMRR